MNVDVDERAGERFIDRQVAEVIQLEPPPPRHLIRPGHKKRALNRTGRVLGVIAWPI